MENWYFEVGETYICGHLCTCYLVSEFPLQLLERQVYSVARLCPDQSFLSLCHLRRVVGLIILDKVNSDSNHCLFSDLPSAST